MKIGIFYELQLPRPWKTDSEYQLFQNALTQIELADKLGYDYAWEVEHHFMILLNQAGTNTHEHICESLGLFAREVMPRLADLSTANIKSYAIG